MHSLLVACFVALTLVAGCGNPGGSQHDPTDDDPKRIAQDAAQLPRLQFAKATTQPIAVRYEEDSGNRPPSPGEPNPFEYRPVYCAIWDDGLVLWRQDERDLQSPLLHAQLDAPTMQSMRERLQEADRQARALKMRSYIVPDGGYVSINLSLPGQVPVVLNTWREDHYVPAEHADAYKAMMDVWNLIRSAMNSAKPAAGQPVSPDNVLWIESDGRKGIRKP